MRATVSFTCISRSQCLWTTWTPQESEQLSCSLVLRFHWCEREEIHKIIVMGRETHDLLKQTYPNAIILSNCVATVWVHISSSHPLAQMFPSSVMLLLFFSFIWSLRHLKGDACPDFRGSEINPTKGWLSPVASSPQWRPLTQKGTETLCPLLKLAGVSWEEGWGSSLWEEQFPSSRWQLKFIISLPQNPSHLLLLKLGKAQSFHPFSLISLFSEKIWGKSSLHFFPP